MGKVSNATKDAVETSLGIQEGNVEVLECVCKVHQFPPNKKTGKQSAPFTCVAYKLQLLDADLDPIDDAEPEYHYFSLGKESVDRFHPGNIDNRDDDEPSDEGTDVDTEGNTINAVNGAVLNKKCKWMIHCASLEKQGFKPEILNKGYLPDHVGLKGHVITHKMDKIDDGDKDDRKDPPTLLIFDKIFVFPYSKKKEAAAPQKKGGQTGTGKKDAAAETNGGGGDAAKDKATEILTTLAGKLSEQSAPIKKLKTLAQAEMIKDKTKGALSKEVLALFDTPWLEETGKDELGLIDEIEDGVVTFK